MSACQNLEKLVIAVQDKFWDPASQCPLNAAADQIWLMSAGGRYDGTGRLTDPEEGRMMCACFDSLSKGLKAMEFPAFCQDITSIGELATTFRSLGEANRRSD